MSFLFGHRVLELMAFVAVRGRLAVFLVAGRARQSRTVVMRLMRIGFSEVFGLFGKRFVGAVAGRALLVIRNYEWVAPHSVFLCVADGTVAENLFVVFRNLDVCHIGGRCRS